LLLSVGAIELLHERYQFLLARFALKRPSKRSALKMLLYAVHTHDAPAHLPTTRIHDLLVWATCTTQPMPNN
jgi:hypothetical protein